MRERKCFNTFLYECVFSAAAVAAAIGAASGAMAAIYTTRKKDEELGVAEEAKKLAEALNTAAAKCISIADDDASAYAALQVRTHSS